MAARRNMKAPAQHCTTPGSRPTNASPSTDRRGQAGRRSSLYPAPAAGLPQSLLVVQWWAGAISACYGPCGASVSLGPACFRAKSPVTVFRRRHSRNHFRNSSTISRVIRVRNSGFIRLHIFSSWGQHLAPDCDYMSATLRPCRPFAALSSGSVRIDAVGLPRSADLSSTLTWCTT